MKITKNKISLSAEEAFACLYRQDQKLWEKAIDYIADYADECYRRHFKDTPEIEPPIQNGIYYSGSDDAIYFANEED